MVACLGSLDSLDKAVTAAALQTDDIGQHLLRLLKALRRCLFQPVARTTEHFGLHFRVQVAGALQIPQTQIILCLRVILLRRTGVPVYGCDRVLLTAEAAAVSRCQQELCTGVALLCRLEIPGECFLGTGFKLALAAVLAQNACRALRADMSELCRLGVPAQRLGVILTHALTVFIAQTQIERCRCRACTCRLTEQKGCILEVALLIRLDALAHPLVALALLQVVQQLLCLLVTLCRSSLGQRDGLVKVALYQITLAVQQCKIELCRSVAQIGRLAQPLDCLLAIGLKAQAFHVQRTDKQHGARIAQLCRCHRAVKAALERALYALASEEQLAELKDCRRHATLCSIAQRLQSGAVIAAVACRDTFFIECVCLFLGNLEGGLGLLCRLLFHLLKHRTDFCDLGLSFAVTKLLGLF